MLFFLPFLEQYGMLCSWAKERTTTVGLEGENSYDYFPNVQDL